MSIHAPEYVRKIAPYQAGKPISELAREYGLDEASIVKLASNENPLGMPESARRAMAAAIDDLGRYPDSNGFELKAEIARRYAVPQDWITLGNGSNDILEIAAHALLQPGESAVYSQYSFVVYALATQAIGARAIVVPARDLGHDLDAMAAAIEPDTRIVFVANPNNPTGTFQPAPAVQAFLEKVPQDVVVVLDEAYNEYLDPGLRFDSSQWVRRFPNLIVSRTLSKAYGLAGLRVGFALAQPELTDLMNRIRQPFNVNSLAQAAAIAALGDDAFLQHSYELNRQGKQRLEKGFSELGLQYVPSYGNFVLVRVGDSAAVYERLLRAGVIVRPVAGYGLPEWLRVSIGLPEENEKFLAALPAALGR
ncbi:histidinol-phosphate transaminase [Burkholderiaceae bacterium FT117]|uniref:histidinol-phosphate transaminase n=1 Tax=Zeimonas sediminis TaxID=2944268 RepID=UPI0023430553|nr:histidinol-phosphate transaminase [Zeimonas sediminis]MCM5570023.1 histidinol-phosphate transaminase [Zeimonas sediminis]